MSQILLGLLILRLTIGSTPASAAEPQHQQILVYAAASLTDAMREICQKTAHVGVKLSSDASSTLARQIEQGAPADVFFSADTDWMDYLQKRNLIQPATRKNLLGSALVLVAPVESTIKLTIAPHFPLLAGLNGGLLATGAGSGHSTRPLGFHTSGRSLRILRPDVDLKVQEAARSPRW